MSLPELTSPIRMYWDLGAPDADTDYIRIADAIAAHKVLTLQITLAGELNESCRIVLGRLKDKPLAQSLVLPVSAWHEDALGLVKAFAVRLLLVSASSLGEMRSILPIPARAAKENPAFGVAFRVSGENFHDLPEVLKFCLEHQIQDLVLPMQRLAGSEGVCAVSREEHKKLTAELSRIERPASLRITIHDPFLWRAFFPSGEFPGGGCQAANTMLYISPDADVYPCPAMPINIGSLKQMPLTALIASDVKKDVRQSILAAPADCIACDDLKQCKGGCRGRAYAIAGSLKGADPACR